MASRSPSGCRTRASATSSARPSPRCRRRAAPIASSPSSSTTPPMRNRRQVPPDLATMTITPRHYRTIWISDIHLGTRGCKAEFLLDFLRYTESQYLYLVGDIVDGWRLRRSWYWAQSHNDVIQKVLRKARKGTKVFYVPGNHDEWLRDYTELQMGGVWLLR